MTATIATTDRFTRIRVGFDHESQHGFASINFDTDADPVVSGYIDADSGSLPTSGERADNLDILQQIWASADGFRDADGNDIVVELQECPFTTDIAELPKHGFLNVLDADSWDDWVTGLQNVGEIHNADRTEDSTTGKASLALHADIGSDAHVPDGDTFAAGLRRWTVRASGDDYFDLINHIDPSYRETYADLQTGDTLRNLPGVRAMEALLRTFSSSLDDTDEFDLSMADFRNLDLSWTPKTGGDTIVFRVLTQLGVPIEDGKVAALEIALEKTSASPDYNETDIQDYLDGQTIDTNVDDQPLEDTFTGTRASILRGTKILVGGDDNAITNDGDHLGYAFKDPDGTKRKAFLTGDFGRSIDLADITIASGDTYKRVPSWPFVREVHLSAAATAHENVMLPLPSRFVGQKDVDRILRFHNANATYKLTLRDWRGLWFFVLKPHERATFIIRQKARGAGECTSLVVPDRRLVYKMTEGSLDALGDWPKLNIETPADGISFVFEAPSTPSGFEFLDDDFFQRGTGNWTSNLNIQDQTDEGNVRKVGSFKILGDVSGYMQMDTYARIQLKSGSTGTMTDVTTRLFRFRSGAISDLDEQDGLDMLVDGQAYAHRGAFREHIENGDVIIPTIFTPDGYTLNDLDNALGKDLEVSVVVEPQISLEYSP